jgi:peptidoglycan-associated lipoprotein
MHHTDAFRVDDDSPKGVSTMNAKLTAVSAIAFVAAFAAQARAQTASQPTAEQPEEKVLAAPTRALELVVGSGYTQGFGELQKGVSMKDVITPGIAVDVGVGYRFNPRWQFGVMGQYQEFNAVRSPGARGMTAGIDIAYHGMPYSRVDPWLQFGVGYRGLWETNPTGPDLLTQGLQLGKLTLGLDLRTSRDIAIAPVIGADISLPLWQGVAGSSATTITDPRAAAYVFAGLQARFDVTSVHDTGQPPPQPVATTQVTEAQVTPAPAPQPATPPPIAVSEEVRDECKLVVNSVDASPKFEFDKSEILPSDIDMLNKVAECFTTGPLKNDRILLVGRADPRGPAQYNQALGMRRATAVADYLEKNGIDDKRIEKTSRGEKDATGTDEAGWAKDRRVDVLRIEVFHQEKPQ